MSRTLINNPGEFKPEFVSEDVIIFLRDYLEKDIVYNRGCGGPVDRKQDILDGIELILKHKDKLIRMYERDMNDLMAIHSETYMRCKHCGRWMWDFIPSGPCPHCHEDQ